MTRAPKPLSPPFRKSGHISVCASRRQGGAPSEWPIRGPWLAGLPFAALATWLPLDAVALDSLEQGRGTLLPFGPTKGGGPIRYRRDGNRDSAEVQRAPFPAPSVFRL
jgi:hypothetical protein